MFRKNTLYLKDPRNGKVVVISPSFSCLFLFFGAFLPLYNKDWKGFFLFSFLVVLLPVFGNVIGAFIYNECYIRRLFSKKYNLMYYKGKFDIEKFGFLKKFREEELSFMP